MNAATIDHLVNAWLHPGRRQLDKLLQRTPAVRSTLLLVVHGTGCLLMLAAPLAMTGAAAGAIYLYYQVRGPLDWFLIEMLSVVALVGAYLSVQLALLRPESPRGVKISEALAPGLFASLAHRVAHFRIRPVNEVLLTTDTGLQIVATPRLPVPLLHRYTLCIGAPVTLFLNRGQFGLALAGTVAATAGNRSHLKGRLVQASDDWRLILAALECRNNLLHRLLARPLRQIAALAAHLSEPLRTDWRQQQGQWLRRHSEEHHTAEYLANQLVAESFMQRQYWPMILKSAERCPTPVVKAFSHLPLLLEKTLSPSMADRWLAQAQTAGTSSGARIRDLLAELQIERLDWNGLPETSAFSAMFKSTTVLKQLDACWQQDIEPEWRQRHASFQDDQARFQQLRRRAEQHGLRDESALRYIKLCTRFLKPADAQTACREVYDSNRDDPRVCFAAGVALLRTGAGQKGIQALQRAADLDRTLAGRARALIIEHRQAWVRSDGTETSHAVRGICA